MISNLRVIFLCAVTPLLIFENSTAQQESTVLIETYRTRTKESKSDSTIALDAILHTNGRHTRSLGSDSLCRRKAPDFTSAVRIFLTLGELINRSKVFI